MNPCQVPLPILNMKHWWWAIWKNEWGVSNNPLFQQTDGEKSIGVFVSSVTSPDCFHVQKVGPNSIRLDKLSEEMTHFYDQKVNRHMHSLTDVQEHAVVATQFTGDGQWYRAKVHKIVRDEYDESKVMVGVDFVDFGDCEEKALTEVCQLRPEFCRLKFQAIKCRLIGIKPQ